eukprot:SAG22_NODE_207_length_15278_cov_4.056855_8_plen_196_part_00
MPADPRQDKLLSGEQQVTSAAVTVVASEQPAEGRECVGAAFICWYWTLRSPADCLFGCEGKQELLCLLWESCLAANPEKSHGLGCVEQTGEYESVCCGCGCFCCKCALKSPEVCISGESNACCLRSVVSLPFDDRFVAAPVCAYCCLQCVPNCGCCQPPPIRAAMAVPVRRTSFAGNETPVPGVVVPAAAHQMDR